MLATGLAGLTAIPIASSVYWILSTRYKGGSEPNPLMVGAVGQVSALFVMLVLSVVLHISLQCFLHYDSLSKLLGVTVLSLSFILVVSYISEKTTGEGDLVNPGIREAIRSLGFFRSCMALLVLAPLTEELIFRGFLQYSIAGFIGGLASLLLVSILFSLMHYRITKPLGVLLVFVTGLVFGLPVYLGSGLYASVASHLTANLYGLVRLDK